MNYVVFDENISTQFFDVVKIYIDKAFDTGWGALIIIFGVAVFVRILWTIVG